MLVRAAVAVAITIAATGCPTDAAMAQDCSPRAVHARGGPGLIEGTAKSRARSAWIKRVRGDRRLGKEYAAWLRARDPSYACRKIGRHIVCDASAKPCRLEPAPPVKGR